MSLTTNDESIAHVSEKGNQSLPSPSPHVASAIKHHLLRENYKRITQDLLRNIKSKLGPEAYQRLMEECMHPHPDTKSSALLAQETSGTRTKRDEYYSLFKIGKEGNLSVFEGSVMHSGQPTTIRVKMTKAQREMLYGGRPSKDGGKNLSLPQKKRLAASLASNTL